MSGLLTPEEISEVIDDMKVGLTFLPLSLNKVYIAVCKAQLAKVLNAPPEGGTDAISWGKGVQDGISGERKRIRLIVGSKLRFSGKPDPYNDAIREIFEALDKGEK